MVSRHFYSIPLMPEPLPTETVTASCPDANITLAHQITQALRTQEYIAASEEEEVFSLLTTGNVKAGDWFRLLEKNVLSTPTVIDNAPTHHPA